MQLQKLIVYSVGKGDQVKFLGWPVGSGLDQFVVASSVKSSNSPVHVLTETELLKREASFSTFRPLNILMCTWNLDDARSDMLTGIENTSSFETHLQSMESPDIVIFGFQEVINLEDHKLTASALLLTCDCLHALCT